MKKMYMTPEVELLTMNVEMPMAASDPIGTDIPGGPGFGGKEDGEGDVKESKYWDIWN